MTAVETGLNSTPSTGLGFHKARAAASDSNPDTSVLSISEIDDQGASLYPEKKEEIETGVHKLETLLESSVDKNFDKFEIYVLRNILSIRLGLERWVQLEHYQDLQFPPHIAEQGELSPEGLLLKRKKLCAARKLNASLVAEQRRNELLLSELRRMLLSRQALSASDFIGSASDSADQPLSPNLAFLVSSNEKATGNHLTRGSPLTTQSRAVLPALPQLRALLRTLHEASAQDGISAPMDSSRAQGERRAYLEAAVRSGVGDGSGWNGADQSSSASFRGTAPLRGDVAAIETIAAQVESRPTAADDAEMDD